MVDRRSRTALEDRSREWRGNDERVRKVWYGRWWLAVLTSALAIRAPRRCISSPHWTGSPACVACSACSRGVVTGAADGYFRNEGHAGLDAAASRSRPRQRPCQSAQCQEGAFRHRQHRRPACDLPHRLQRAADFGHRGPGPADVGLGSHLARRQIRGGRWRRPRSPRRRARRPRSRR